jgi:hypothetical protein
VIGVAAASAVLILYFRKPVEEQRTRNFVRIGIALCLLVLIRRWYIFWAAAFFPAALAAFLAAPPRGVHDRRGILCLVKGLAVAGSVCFGFLLLLAGPLVLRAVLTDYSVAFVAYRSSVGAVGQVIGQFGPVLLAVSAAGLASLIASPRTRGVGVLLVVQAALSLALFTHVQKFLGVQHYYILVPALGIGVAAAAHALWDAPFRRAWRTAGIASVCAAVLLSSIAVFSPTPLLAGPLLPRDAYPPLVRPDLPEIDRLLGELTDVKPHRVYVVASSEALNWSTLKMRCGDTHPELCAHIATTSDIDTRDGFPVGFVGADYALLATPVQYHVNASDQQVVGLLARDLISRQGVGRSFEPMGGEFRLKQGVRVQIYRRVAPMRESDLEQLSAQLTRSYPGMDIFEYPIR